jgi:hypothetical protein
MPRQTLEFEKRYNRFVRGRLHRRLLTTAGLVLLVTLSDGIALRFAVEAAECCAKSKAACARLTTPDDCCRAMGHGSGELASTKAPSSHELMPALVTVAAILPGPSIHILFSAGTDAFKRPHDPPHLHPIPLLI